VHEAGGAWVAERPLVAMYRRWKRGEDWRERWGRGLAMTPRGGDRESYSFSPLVRSGLLDMGQWGQEKFYRLSPRGRQLLEPPEDDGFRQFYLTPSFEIMAPAGLAPVLLFRIGELATLTGCDRANTFKIDESSIQRALDRGWRRDDVLQFLRDNSQIGVPENVESTLKGWIGHRGDVEFHDLVLMTVHRSQIRRLEGNRRIKPLLLHRFAPGMYAVDRHRLAEIEAVLRDSGFDPVKDVRRYPGDPEQVEARQALHKMLVEARESAIDPLSRGDAVPPERMQPVPGTRAATQVPAEEEPEVAFAETPDAIRQALDRAMSDEADVEMVYIAKNGQKLACRVHPERLAFKSDAPVLVGLDKSENERRTYLLDRIERLRIVGA
jgi:signal recognition particle subunit SEC65